MTGSDRILRIGLTGGIGSGKSTVTERFRELGVPVLDADEYSRRLTAAGMPLADRIVREFGEAVRSADGTLDRARLRAIVFADATARRHLEAILHPAILAEMERASASLDGPYCVFAIPLLFESGQDREVDRIVTVEAPRERRIEWVMRRSGLSRSEVEAIIAVQAPDEVRRAKADDVIVNDGSLDDLRRKVDVLHARYLASSHRGRGSG